MPKEKLDEFKSSHSDSATADPVVPEGGGDTKRKADKDSKADAMDSVEGAGKKEDAIEKASDGKKMPKRLADKESVSEAVTTIFEGHDVTEEFKEKAETIFEAVVNGVIEEEIEALHSKLEEQVQEATDQAIEGLVEKLDMYLEYAVDLYMKENELALENGIKAEMAESFLSSLKSLFEDNYIEVDEEKIDVIHEMDQRNEELAENLNDTIADNIKMRRILEGYQRKDVVAELSEGMTDTKADKLREHASNIDADDIDEFKKKLSYIKESLVEAESKFRKESADDLESLNESTIDENKAPVNGDPMVTGLAEQMKNFINR